MIPVRVELGGSDERAASPPDDRVDPFGAYRFVGNAVALIILAASLAELWTNLRHPSARDFLGCWGAAQLALAGHAAAAYDSAALHAVQSAAATFGDSVAELPFPYPPAYLLLIIPFALLSFPSAMAAWLACTCAFYLFAAKRLFPRSGWLAAAFPAVFATAAIGQNGFLTSGIFMLGLSLLKRSPFAAGLVLGCLIIKPQLGIALPIALLAGRHFRAVAGAAISSAAILLVGLALFGAATTVAWLHEAPLILRVTSEGLMGWSKLASIYAAARQLGASPDAAIAIHTAVALAAAAVVWRVWRSPAEQGLKNAVLAAAAMLMSPYVFYYDGLMLVPAFLWLVRGGRRPALFLALWCVPLLAIAQMALGDYLNVNPIAPLALLALCYSHWRSTGPAGARENPGANFNLSATVRGKNFSRVEE
jgi:hypothetical protein